MIILIHSSKTMRPQQRTDDMHRAPQLIEHTRKIAAYLKQLSVSEIETSMKVSRKLALSTKTVIDDWTDDPSFQRPAIDAFLGDIYSGLQVQQWTDEDRKYADEHVRILSGLYGILRPFDGICPYRLEMGYRLPNKEFSNLYTFWSDSIARTLDTTEPILNLAAVEYSKSVTQHVGERLVVAPKFLTIHPETKEPTFVVVHAKIARGAYASWVVRNRIDSLESIRAFDELGYELDSNLSTDMEPVFVCSEFLGLGLSVRLS